MHHVVAARPLRVGGRARWAVALGAACATVIVALAACADEADPPAVLDGWRPGGTYGHLDVVHHDRVAVASGPTPGWMTWDQNRDDRFAVWLWDVGAGSHVLTPLAMPPPTDLPSGLGTSPDAVFVPEALGVCERDFIAVASAASEPGGLGAGLVAWQGRGGGAPLNPTPLALPDGQRIARPPAIAACVGSTSVVAVLTGPGLPDALAAPEVERLVMWRSVDGGGWEVVEFPQRRSVTSVGLTADGDRFVLAGVDTGGVAHLWTSPDGLGWEPAAVQAREGAVADVQSITAVEPGVVAAAWSAVGAADDASDPATTTAVVTLVDDTLTDRGTIAVPDHSDAGSATQVNGVARGPDRDLVAVGAVVDGAPSAMIWALDDDTWVPSDQPQIAGRYGVALRAVAVTDDGLLAIAVPFLHLDVELWSWRPEWA